MQAAETLDCSRPRISNLESGRAIPSKLELPALLTLYGAVDRLPVLEELRVAANEPGWWSVFGLPIWLQAYVRLESDAKRVRCFALELVPGLLQTQGYASAVQQLYGSTVEETERRVAVLMERQRRVEDGVDLSVVASEALLHRTMNMGAVGAEQLQRLAAANVRVVPFAAGMHRAVSAQFTVLDFPGRDELPVAYEEHAVGGHLVDDREVVAKLTALYQELCDVALDVEDSAAMIGTFTEPTREGAGQ